MPRVTFLPWGRHADVEPGADLLAAASKAGAPVSSECGGAGTCGSCLVFVEQGAVEGGVGPPAAV